MPMGRLQYKSIGTAYLAPIFDGEHIGSAAAHEPTLYVYHGTGGKLEPSGMLSGMATCTMACWFLPTSRPATNRAIASTCWLIDGWATDMVYDNGSMGRTATDVSSLPVPKR